MTSTLGDSFLGEQGPPAHAMAHLFRSALVISGVIFLLIVVLVGFCVVRFRARAHREAAQTSSDRRLEIAWTLGPVAILIWLLVMTSRAMAVADPPIDRAPDLTVIAHQWWWEARYPSGAVTANEIHLPVGRPLVLRIESQDVVHDFWVPALGRKVDAIPGRPVSIWLEADASGTYLGTCAEFCGAQHAWMRIRVIAEPAEQFLAWEGHEAATAAAPAAEARRGLEVFRAKMCVSCHAVRGVDDASVGPDLTHIAARATLGAGVINNTPTELARWLRDPQQIKAGCHMPNAQLSEDDVSSLVTYLETLR